MRMNIQAGLQFANEMVIEDASKVENLPKTSKCTKAATKPEKCIAASPKHEKEYFDEVSGRFLPGSVEESEDPFQIVLNDCPKVRRTSDCESEDSFIVFEDSPDNCYTSNDVFEETSDSEESNSDSEESDSDSDVGGSGKESSSFNLVASSSRSVNNLADDSLHVEHSEDEVDCCKVRDMTVCDNVDVGRVDPGEVKSGPLIDDRKKLLRKSLPAKQVQFSDQPPKVHVMRVWSFAARQARAGHWERYALDRARFKRRIANVDEAVSWVLKTQHRSTVMMALDKLGREEELKTEEVEKQKPIEGDAVLTDVLEGQKIRRYTT